MLISSLKNSTLSLSSRSIGRLLQPHDRYTRKYASQSTSPPLLRPNAETPVQHHSNDPLNHFIHDNIHPIAHFQPLPSGSHRSNISTTLPLILPYESYPDPTRRADPTHLVEEHHGDGIVVVIHLVKESLNKEVDFVVSSGFIIEPEGSQDEQLVITCSHTLDQISNRYPQTAIHSFIVPSASSSAPSPIPITAYPSSCIADLLVCAIPRPDISLRSLPVSPFPIYKGQKVLVHEYGSSHLSNSIPWIGSMIQREWISAEMLGYRNYGWREVQPGTSSALPYITFSTRPSNGSSGGPIDIECGQGGKRVWSIGREHLRAVLTSWIYTFISEEQIIAIPVEPNS
ncbi:hypothetical protein I302_107205 [Kwoniella bestiolae CBS 10118]|uniref:Serine protease n=1 Tax=Kwoniella bestiolae CBS 10118 TaxID=1296100 RepID=A0AAJ8KDA2_9TREE